MSPRIVTRGIGCALTLLVLSAQAIDYEVYRRDEEIKTQPTNDTVLSSRDLLERLNHVEVKASYSLQEATEHLLHYGALLRTRILDTFGNLLYIHYDDFSVEEVVALRNVYRDTLERRYNIFHLVAHMLRNPNMKPSRICAEIYALAEPCLRSSANMCRGIRKRHDLPYSDNLVASNTTYLAYHSSKISRQYPGGFSLPALLKLLHRGVLSITPGLLSGLLCHMRYDDYDGDVLLAERELMRYFHEVARSTRRSFQGILESMSPKELRDHHSMASFLRYYISIHVERLASDKLKRYALLIVKHLVDDVGTIDENIHLLGNVYENGTVHIGYLFDLVLPDDVLHDDVIGAKRYLVDKLNEFDVLERYLRVSKYQQATPAHLVMEITGQLQDIGFVEDIAAALRIHARFWRRSYMVESLHELLRLLDAYENLRRVARHQDVMKNLDEIKRSLSDMQDVPIEILCGAPRACLRNGLRMLLDCKLVSPEIKELIGDFFKQLSPKGAPLDDECLIPMNTVKEFRRTSDIQDLDVPKISISMEMVENLKAQTEMDVDDISELETTEVETAEIKTTTTTIRGSMPEEEDDFSEITMASFESYKSEGSAESSETADETKKKISEEIEFSLEESVESSSTKATENAMYETTEPTLTITTTTTTTTRMIDNTSESYQEETTTTATSTIAMATTSTATTMSGTTLEEIPNIDMEIEMKKSKMVTMSEAHDEDSDMDATSASSTTPVTIASKKSCESGDCNGERSSEESSEHEETSTTSLSMTTESATTTMMSPTTTQDFVLETTREIRATSPGTSSSQELSMETAEPATSEMLITEDKKCTESSCSRECARSKSESGESSSCRTGDCDFLMEDCDDENSSFEDTKSERSENSTVECHPKVVCEEESSPEVLEGCDTPQNERCVKVCASREQARSSSCEDQDDDCSAVELPTVDLKFERARNHSVCEIQDPHHRRQMRRLARMRAISAATLRHDDVLESLRRSPRRRDRTATEKLYELLASKSPRSENDKTKTAEYSSLGTLTKMKLEEGGRKKHTFGRKQRDQLHVLREKLAKRYAGGKSRQGYRSGRTSVRRGQTEMISRRSARSSVDAPLRDSAMAYRDLSM